MNGAPWIAMWIGALCIVIGLAGYNWLYWRARGDFSGFAFRETIAQLVSHLPDDDSAAWPHILSGVALTVGVSLVSGFAIEGFAAQFDGRVPTGTGATLAGIIFGAEIGAISFWTLWQTKRIERGQGQMVHGFSALATAMSREMKFLWEELERSSWVPQADHRFLLVTTNPWFGMLSSPHSKSTTEFREGLERLAHAVTSCKNSKPRGFTFGILMGDAERLKEFHELYFSDLSGAAKDAAVQGATDKLNGLIDTLLKYGVDRDNIKEKVSVPAFQFAVIGGVVFEFILDTVGGTTEVHRARMLRERVLCERFVQTYRVLEALP
ncbi:MAG TPA: hypothetical protein VNJ70_03620 [Thermoanaerobaculia bacterium]|nr:hypothetical protein [Thermoanaerobaculia bacterium]